MYEAVPAALLDRPGCGTVQESPVQSSTAYRIVQESGATRLRSVTQITVAVVLEKSGLTLLDPGTALDSEGSSVDPLPCLGGSWQ